MDTTEALEEFSPTLPTKVRTILWKYRITTPEELAATNLPALRNLGRKGVALIDAYRRDGRIDELLKRDVPERVEPIASNFYPLPENTSPLPGLSNRECYILTYRYGKERLPYRVLAKRLGLSPARVQQIDQSARRKASYIVRNLRTWDGLLALVGLKIGPIEGAE